MIDTRKCLVILQTEVQNGKELGFTVFHDSVVPPDDFVANCRVAFQDLQLNQTNDFWLDLEPHGRLHLVIEPQGTMTDGECRHPLH